MTVITANRITLARTLLCVPIAVLLRLGRPFGAFLCAVLHDYLDHLDGIVAKVDAAVAAAALAAAAPSIMVHSVACRPAPPVQVHRSMGYVDDPLLGAFLDALCDKFVNVFCLWSILLLTRYEAMADGWDVAAYVTIIGLVIAYEAVIGVVRVEDYYHARYAPQQSQPRRLAATMEGKLKECVARRRARGYRVPA